MVLTDLVYEKADEVIRTEIFGACIGDEFPKHLLFVLGIGFIPSAKALSYEREVCRRFDPLLYLGS